ncbi:MAG TPA: hypothetical protein VKD69_07550 [Vicinamibacterales bacterium]|nr:hypothetical protein [Vicinamibacterales bacterium]
MSEPGTVDIVHRLKNHIAIVVGFTELLLSDCTADDPKRADLLEVHQAARQALALMPEVARRIRGEAHAS